MAFFKRGREGREAALKRDAENKLKAEQRKNMPREFWMRKGETMRVLFLDSPDFFVGRHTIKVKGKFDKVVCIDDSGVICPGCASGKTAPISVVSTIIMLDAVKSADGTKSYIYQRQLLCVAGDAQNFLFKIIDKEKKKNPKFTLKGCVVELSRGTTETAAAVGAFSLEGRLSEKALNSIKEKIVKAKINGDIKIDDYFKPFDYEKAFQPLPMEDLKKIFGVDDAYGEGDDDFTSADDLVADDDTTETSPFSDDLTGDGTEETEIAAEAEDTDDTTADDSYGDMSDKELFAELIEAGVSPKEAKGMDRDERISWLRDNNASEEQEESEGLESLSVEELRAMAIEKGMSKKAAAKMDADDLIEAINELAE